MVVHRDFGVAVVSTHSRPKAAGTDKTTIPPTILFQHTAARRRLEAKKCLKNLPAAFQHTAARRRLVLCLKTPF